MAIYYGAFAKEEKSEAFRVLREFIRQKDDHFDVGVSGNRVLFRVLSDFGEYTLAHKLIAQPSFPSFGYHIGLGATSLFESFYQLNDRFEIEDGRWLDILSQNHHFWGDIAAFFVEYFAGLRINPQITDVYHIDIAPCCVAGMTHANAVREMPYGTVRVAWEVKDNMFLMTVEAPQKAHGTVYLPDGEVRPLEHGITKYKVSVVSCVV